MVISHDLLDYSHRTILYIELPPDSIENERENFVLISISDGEVAWFFDQNIAMGMRN